MLALLLSLTLTAADGGPWHLVGPGGGGWIQSVAYSPHNPRTLFVGCDVGGFYRSDDAGASWRIQNSGLRDPFVQAIVPHPTKPETIYLATLSGPHRSDDGGRTWRLLRNGFPPTDRYRYTAPLGCLVMDPKAPDTLYAGIGSPREHKWGQGAVWVTRDGGEHWSRYNAAGTLPDDAIVSDILPRADGLLVVTSRGLYRTADGSTMTKLAGGLPAERTRYLATCASRPAVLYCTVESTPGKSPLDGGVFRSDDGGASWTRRVEGLHQWAKEGDGNRMLTSQYDHLAVDPANPDHVYVSGAAWVNAGVFGSEDGGLHWRRLTNTDKAHPPVNLDQGYIGWGPVPESWALHPADAKRLLFGTSGSVIETLDGGTSWKQLHTTALPGGEWRGTGVEVTCLWTLGPHPTRGDEWLLGYMDIANWRTTNAGASMARAMTGVSRDHDSTGTAYAWDPQAPDTVWAGMGQWGSNRGGLYVSRDAGRGWSLVPGLPEARVAQVVLDPTSPVSARRLWVNLSEKGLFTGPADGSDWQRADAGLTGPVSSLVWAGGPMALTDRAKDQPGGVWKRDAAGWQRLDKTPFAASMRALAVAPGDPQRLYVATRDDYIAPTFWPGGLYGSTDGGASWKRLFTDRFVSSVVIDPRDPRHLVVGTNDHPYHNEPLGHGVHESRDGGATWRDITDNLPLPNIACLAFDAKGRLLAGTGGCSLWWRE